MHIPYGSFVHVPLGLPNSSSLLLEPRGTRWPQDPRSLDGTEVEIVNTMFGGAYARLTDPAFVIRFH